MSFGWGPGTRERNVRDAAADAARRGARGNAQADGGAHRSLADRLTGITRLASDGVAPDRELDLIFVDDGDDVAATVVLVEPGRRHFFGPSSARERAAAPDAGESSSRRALVPKPGRSLLRSTLPSRAVPGLRDRVAGGRQWPRGRTALAPNARVSAADRALG